MIARIGWSAGWGPGLDICVLNCLSSYVLGSGFVPGVDTVILECVVSSVRCLASLSVCPGVLSAISDGMTDYLTGFITAPSSIINCLSTFDFILENQELSFISF